MHVLADHDRPVRYQLLTRAAAALGHRREPVAVHLRAHARWERRSRRISAYLGENTRQLMRFLAQVPPGWWALVHEGRLLRGPATLASSFALDEVLNRRIIAE